MDSIMTILQGFLTQLDSLARQFIRPWGGYQLLIVLAVFAVAYVLRGWWGPKMRAWMASREGWPTWRMRILVTIHKRLRGIIFVVLMWCVIWVMREITWPSRSYILAIVATLATAWVVVALATRLIRNTFLRAIVRYGAWIWVTLSILDFDSQAKNLLQAAAVEVGDSNYSLWNVGQAIVILFLLFTVARFLSATASDRVNRNEDMSPSMRVLVMKFLQVLLFGAAFYIGLRAVGFDLSGLAFLSGAIGVGLGFGLQKVVSNLVSGVIILLDKSIKPGDVISIGQTFGWINALSARYVSITTRDGREYLVPNEDLITGQVVNWSHSNDFVRLDIHFGTAYGDDPHLVRKLAIEAATTVDRVLPTRPAVCHITGFGDSSVDYILRFWITDPTQGLTNIRGNVYLALWDTFQEHGISIPFPQREVKMLD